MPHDLQGLSIVVTGGAGALGSAVVTELVTAGASVVVPSSFTTFAITITVALTLVIGVLPQLVLQLVDQAGVFVR